VQVGAGFEQVSGENGGQAVALFGIGSVGNAPELLERLDVEEAQGASLRTVKS
jgi:hypothetical protein